MEVRLIKRETEIDREKEIDRERERVTERGTQTYIEMTERDRKRERLFK